MKKLVKIMKMMKQVNMIKPMIMRARSVSGSRRITVSPRLPRTWVSLRLQIYSGQPKATVNWGPLRLERISGQPLYPKTVC